MPKKLSLTLACGDNEIVRPLMTGQVKVDGVDLTMLTDMDSATRTEKAPSFESPKVVSTRALR